MKTYADLNLAELRDACGLDFAHYTYLRGQCSCCYGPEDMAAKYWRGKQKPVHLKEPKLSDSGVMCDLELRGKPIRHDEYSYILFKNADNGSGRIKSKDEQIRDYTCITYNFLGSDEQKNRVCEALAKQLDEDYLVVVPKTDMTCIILRFASNADRIDEESCSYVYEGGTGKKLSLGTVLKRLEEKKA